MKVDIKHSRYNSKTSTKYNIKAIVELTLSVKTLTAIRSVLMQTANNISTMWIEK